MLKEVTMPLPSDMLTLLRTAIKAVKAARFPLILNLKYKDIGKAFNSALDIASYLRDPYEHMSRSSFYGLEVLSYCVVEDKLMAAIEALANRTGVQASSVLVNIVETLANNIKDALAYIIEVAQVPLTLDLRYNDIDDALAIALASAVEKIESQLVLYLDNNDIGDQGIVALANAVENANYPLTLSLSMNNIGDDGAMALIKAMRNAHVPFSLNHFDKYYFLPQKVQDLLATEIDDNFIIDAGTDPSRFFLRIGNTLRKSILDHVLANIKKVLEEFIFPNALIDIIYEYSVYENFLSWMAVNAIRSIKGASFDNKYSSINDKLLIAKLSDSPSPICSSTGMLIHPIIMDGNCMYRAVLEGVRRLPSYAGTRDRSLDGLRKEVSDRIYDDQGKHFDALVTQISTAISDGDLVGFVGEMRGVMWDLHDAMIEACKNGYIAQAARNIRNYIETQGIVAQYIRMIYQNSAWGGEVELGVISEILGIKIVVYKNDVTISINNTGNHNADKIHLLYTGGHYDLIVRPGGGSTIENEEQDVREVQDSVASCKRKQGNDDERVSIKRRKTSSSSSSSSSSVGYKGDLGEIELDVEQMEDEENCTVRDTRLSNSSPSSSSSSPSSSGSIPPGGGANDATYIPDQETIYYLSDNVQYTNYDLNQALQLDSGNRGLTTAYPMLKTWFAWIQDLSEELQQQMLSSFSMQQVLKFLGNTLNPDQFVKNRLSFQVTQEKFATELPSYSTLGNFTDTSQEYAKSNTEAPISLDEYTSEPLSNCILMDLDQLRKLPAPLGLDHPFYYIA